MRKSRWAGAVGAGFCDFGDVLESLVAVVDMCDG